MKFLGVTILQGVEFPIFLLIFAWALQQCSATALAVIFTALHRMQTRYSDGNSVRLSVCPSVTRVNCDKTVEISVKIFYTIRKSIYPSFLRRRMVSGGRPLLPEILGQLHGTHWSEIADFQPIFARSSSAVTPSEKSSINTNGKSTTLFPMSLR